MILQQYLFVVTAHEWGTFNAITQDWHQSGTNQEWEDLTSPTFAESKHLAVLKAGLKGAFHFAKISGNFSRNIIGTLEKVGHLQRWFSLIGQSSPTLPFSKILNSCPTSLRRIGNFGRNVNGMPLSGWKFCLYWTMSFHFPLVSSTGLRPDGLA